MIPLLVAALPTAGEMLRCPTFWALALFALGLWLVLPTRFRFGQAAGSVLVAIAGGLAAYDLPRLGNSVDQGVFWLLSAVTLGAAIATIASQSPVYSAIWFALSLLGTAGLFMFQGAQFLGVATVVVYAGAIVVTFLFVIMLAQPEGHSTYDRLTWGGLPKVLGVVTAAALVGVLTFMLGKLKDEARQGRGLESRASAASSAGPEARTAALTGADGVLNAHHMARVGGHLFGEQLISIEIAGTLLLVALVGAIAIAIQGRAPAVGRRLTERIEEALR